MKQLRLYLQCLSLLLAASHSLFAQVPKNVIAEHFTNTYCSICAARNPGFYNNLSQFPQVLHIAYHPSAPYAACPLNQQNKTENDARTNFYGVYGSTPRVVIQGAVIPSSADYNNAQLFQQQLGQTTPFDLSLSLRDAGNNTIQVTAIVRKVASSNIHSLQLYAAVTEDTLLFAAANGELLHQDVFRKSVWGAPMAVSGLINVGDSVVYTQTLNVPAGWNQPQLVITGLLQDSVKNVVQAATSGKLKTATGIAAQPQPGFNIYPNPATDKLFISRSVNGAVSLSIRNLYGQTVQKQIVENTAEAVDISRLAPGIYVLHWQLGASTGSLKFVKQ